MKKSLKALPGESEKKEFLNIHLKKKVGYSRIRIERSLVAIVITDSVFFRSVDCNQAALDLYGFSNKTELIGKNPLEFSVAVQYDGILSIEKAEYFIKRALRESLIIFEWKHQRLNGECWDAEIHLAEIFVGDHTYLQFSVTDISRKKQTELALYQSEEKFSKAFFSSPVAKCITDIHTGNFIEVNDMTCQMLGYERDELLFNSSLELGIWPDTEERNFIMKKLDETGHVANEIIMFKTRNGQMIITKVSADFISYGNEKYLLSVFEDITEQKKAEQKLIENEFFRKRVFDSSPIAIVIMDTKNHQFIDFNLQAINLYGYKSFDEVYLKKPLDVSSPFQYDGTTSSEKALYYLNEAESKGYVSFEWRHQRPDGQIWDARVHLLSFSLGNQKFFQLSLLDITEPKRTEEKLKLSENKYRQLFENMTMAFALHEIIYDSEGRPVDYRFLDANPALEKIFGIPATAIIGRTIREIAPKTEQYWIDTFCNVGITGNSIAYENYASEFKKHFDTWVFSPGKDQFAVVYSDVTERKELERQILNSVIETEERERLHFSQELHDGIGPLLSAAKMFVQWLDSKDDNIEADKIVNQVEKLLDESIRTVREISYKLSPHILQNYGLEEALKAYVDKIKESTSINIQLDLGAIGRFDDKTETVAYRILCECINNTVKHSQARSISIEMHCTDNHLCITYNDDGNGFDINKVSENHKGIGLKNMESRIKSINGSMTIESILNVGTTIKFQMNLLN